MKTSILEAIDTDFEPHKILSIRMSLLDLFISLMKAPLQAFAFIWLDFRSSLWGNMPSPRYCGKWSWVIIWYRSCPSVANKRLTKILKAKHWDIKCHISLTYSWGPRRLYKWEGLCACPEKTWESPNFSLLTDCEAQLKQIKAKAEF